MRPTHTHRGAWLQSAEANQVLSYQSFEYVSHPCHKLEVLIPRPPESLPPCRFSGLSNNLRCISRCRCVGSYGMRPLEEYMDSQRQGHAQGHDSCYS